MFNNILSEYQHASEDILRSNTDLLSPNDALFVVGIGSIAQYHCYLEMVHTHGILYFIRDLLVRDNPEPSPQVTARIEALNSKITLAENANCMHTYAATTPD